MIIGNVKIGLHMNHERLGQVIYSETCNLMQKKNLYDKETLFVDHDGEIKEVSCKLLHLSHTPIAQEILNNLDSEEIREDLKREGIL